MMAGAPASLIGEMQASMVAIDSSQAQLASQKQEMLLPPSASEDIILAYLVKIASQQVDTIDFGWHSTHSFTAFIPQEEHPENRHPYLYQSFFGRYTLQQWFKRNKFLDFQEESITSFVQRLIGLPNAQTRSEVKQHEVDLFALDQLDEKRMLNNPLMLGEFAMRLKFKVIEVDVQSAFRCFKELKIFIDQCYSGDTPSLQLKRYQDEAKSSMMTKLADHLGLTLHIDETSHSSSRPL